MLGDLALTAVARPWQRDLGEAKITLIDGKLSRPDYGQLPKPDLVAVMAFTSQAPRAYEISRMYRPTSGFLPLACTLAEELAREYVYSLGDFTDLARVTKFGCVAVFVGRRSV